MAMQYLEGELRKTDDPRDQALADIVSGVLKVRGKDISLPQVGKEALASTTDVVGQDSEVIVAQEVTSVIASKLKHPSTPFGIVLKAYLYERGLTQKWLAQEVRISPASLSRDMKGRRNPSAQLALAISSVLRLSDEEQQALLATVPQLQKSSS